MPSEAPTVADESAPLLVRLDMLRQEERRTASARVVAVIGHLIGTPLNVMAGRAALIRSDPTADNVLENARRIEEQVERLSQQVRRLVDYFGAPTPAPEHEALSQILDESLALYRPIASQRGLTIDLEPHDLGGARINCALGRLSLCTLLSLATRTTPSGQAITVSVTEAGPRRLVVQVALPGVQAPASRFERLEVPEWPGHYDADVLEVLSICASLARSGGGGLQVVPSASEQGALVRFEWPYS
jgi:signal transduction histidine kinase